MKNRNNTLTPPYSARSWTTGDGVTVFEVSGEVEFYTAPALRNALLGAVRDHHSLIVLDLSQVVFIDSSGIGALVFGCRRSREKNGALTLAALSEQVRHVLGVMGLLKVFAVFDTVEEAQAGVKEAANKPVSPAVRRCRELS